MDLGRDNTARIPDAGLLGEARDLWRALNEHVPDLVLQVRPDGTIFFLNRAPNGPQGSVLLGSNVLDLVAPAMREDVRRSLASMTAAGPARRRLIHAELSDGSRRWYATTAVPVARDGHLGAITIAARDILLEQANPATPADSDRHLKQLAMLGLLSGGLIHNFNNLLTVIGSAAAVLLDALPLTDPLRSEVESIRYATTHGTLLTRQLLRLARRQPVQRARVELNAAVQEVAQLSQLLLGPNVSLVLQLEPLGAPVHIEQGEMEQVLLNLLLNARDAMPGGGQDRRQHRSSAVFRDKRACRLRGAVVRLRVEDTGTGIDETTRERIFEPFFTTKSPERGTGLGLASVAAMVKEAAGCVEIASRLGAGTTVHVVLPDADSVGQRAA